MCIKKNNNNNNSTSHKVGTYYRAHAYELSLLRQVFH